MTFPEGHLNGLSASELRTLEAILEARRAELGETINRRSSSCPRGASDLEMDGFDQAAINQRQAVTLRILEKEVKLLRRIENALQKIENGTYGLCEASGEPIGYPRLKVVPWARYCIAYKERREREQYMETARFAGR